jgi:hypothetical protein
MKLLPEFVKKYFEKGIARRLISAAMDKLPPKIRKSLAVLLLFLLGLLSAKYTGVIPEDIVDIVAPILQEEAEKPDPLATPETPVLIDPVDATGPH